MEMARWWRVERRLGALQESGVAVRLNRTELVFFHDVFFTSTRLYINK